ncbi:hypothetical protein COCSUDRAFT_22502 [Coccomyxa subellipsoidea C-169]|uniref:E2 ubiquitin-conjugating enzyme n=1 Tax=Coccomyxa subellipsoidea (strain C-169) TaxID=574566 RepID=I0Z3D7_COCSC|nr:hypothetical protein COCSUDRAFT_22502 [Coccomyxa subellipsoidea C-169]EIE25156.1 hypothetical protein COCSUDRAFT_22502 [Coccomyxa subellipsoidea C-169]|eukprot:XP_005649700.1 hypothetical protein COCSUDRAFT_22502 [Coccomyxa subellipsoidea C-169]
MSTPARKRLMRDFRRLQQDPPQGIDGSPNLDNIMLWNAVIFGPEDTPWDGGTFKLSLQFTEEYPNKAPVVKFVSNIFHPNVYADGGICLDILQNQWSPIYDVSAILTSIQSLLSDPNPNSPANSEAARLYSENRKEYNRRVKEVVQASWMEGTNGSAPAEEEEEEAEPAAAEDAADTGAEKEEKSAAEPKDQDKDKKEDA